MAKINSKLTVEVLEDVAGLIQAALIVLYNAGVAVGTDSDYGTVAADLERIKDGAKDRAMAIVLAKKPTTTPAPTVETTTPTKRKTTRKAAAQTTTTPAAPTTPAPAPTTPAVKTCKGKTKDNADCRCRMVMANGYCRSHQKQATAPTTPAVEKKPTARKAAAQTVATTPAAVKPATTPAAPTTYPAGTILIVTKDGSLRPVTANELWQAMEKATAA